MWWIFGLHDVVFPLLALKQVVSTYRPEIVGQEFFLLGIIPGTNVQLTFSGIVIAVWLALFVYAIYLLYPKAKKIAKAIDPYPWLPAKMNYIELIAL
jgi:hypothetical protein